MKASSQQVPLPPPLPLLQRHRKRLRRQRSQQPPLPPPPNLQPLRPQARLQFLQTQDPNLALAGEGLAAAAFFSGIFGSDNICLKYFVFILVLIVLVQLLWSKVMYGFYTHPVGKKVWYVGLLVSGIIMLLVREYCVLPLLILTALIIWGLQFLQKEEDHEEDDQKILHKEPLE